MVTLQIFEKLSFIKTLFDNERKINYEKIILFFLILWYPNYTDVNIVRKPSVNTSLVFILLIAPPSKAEKHNLLE